MFFFFKQKTAYEMRISDWSSDVCSSDLIYQRGAFTEQDTVAVAAILSLLALAVPAWIKIGRASCRERVCQYGVDLGGRRIIKKKQHTQSIEAYATHNNINQFHIL